MTGLVIAIGVIYAGWYIGARIESLAARSCQQAYKCRYGLWPVKKKHQGA